MGGRGVCESVCEGHGRIIEIWRGRGRWREREREAARKEAGGVWRRSCARGRGDARLLIAMLCHAMPCYAMLCYAMLCHASTSSSLSRRRWEGRGANGDAEGGCGRGRRGRGGGATHWARVRFASHGSHVLSGRFARMLYDANAARPTKAGSPYQGGACSFLPRRGLLALELGREAWPRRGGRRLAWHGSIA